ncbi:MAG: hypothetical protein IPM86_08960 [Saprospiraceae bacterium]|nr:hypothetical protein [Saprospiraceae bacterium]
MEIPIQLRVLIKTGIDISLCPICKTGKINPDQNKYLHQRHLIDVQTIQNKGSPLINIDIPSKITLNKYCYTFTYRKINVDFSVAKLIKKLIIVLLKSKKLDLKKLN